ncbi:MAG: hypothetical protein M3146_02780 [Thermoproteota archaeon]|nr:hypothetical protein [Thermoproteota archaeon]
MEVAKNVLGLLIDKSAHLIESEVAMQVGAEKKRKVEDGFAFALFSLFCVTCTLPVIQGCTVHT